MIFFGHQNWWLFDNFGVQLGPVGNFLGFQKFREIFKNASIFGVTIFGDPLYLHTVTSDAKTKINMKIIKVLNP